MFLLTLVETYWFTLRAGISVVSNVLKEEAGGGGGAGSPRVFSGGGRRPLFLVEISNGEITQTATNGYFLARTT